MGLREVRIGLRMVKTVHHGMARMVTKIDKIFIIIFLNTARMVIVMIIEFVAKLNGLQLWYKYQQITLVLKALPCSSKSF